MLFPCFDIGERLEDWCMYSFSDTHRCIYDSLVEIQGNTNIRQCLPCAFSVNRYAVCFQGGLSNANITSKTRVCTIWSEYCTDRLSCQSPHKLPLTYCDTCCERFRGTVQRWRVPQPKRKSGVLVTLARGPHQSSSTSSPANIYHSCTREVDSVQSAQCSPH